MGEGFTAYPEEDEVLLQDGLEYSLNGVTEQFTEDTNEKYFIVNLKYPAWNFWEKLIYNSTKMGEYQVKQLL